MKQIIIMICLFLIPAISAKADTSEADKQLIIATEICALHDVQTALANGANINTRKSFVSVTALMIASNRGCMDIVKLLLDKGANVNVHIHPNYITALMLASSKGHTEIVKLLLNKGAEVNYKDADGATALIEASAAGYVEIVKLLLDKGAFVNMKMTDEDGENALMMASERGHTEIVKLLLKKGADATIKNNYDEDALMLAKSRNRTDIVKILETTIARTSVSHPIKIVIVDERPPAEREGHPYPNSWFSYTMHGDHSLNVDRLSILKTKLLERFGAKLAEKLIVLQQFSVMEATDKDSFIITESGKQIPNPGPAVPTLRARITLSIDNDYFSGSSKLLMPKGSRSSKSDLDVVTTKVVDDLIKDIERQKASFGKLQ